MESVRPLTPALRRPSEARALRLAEAQADRRLPPGLRGREGWPALLAGTRIRASAVGPGAFALVRMAHATLRARRLRVCAKARGDPPSASAGGWPLLRDRSQHLFEERLRLEAKAAWPLQALLVAAGCDRLSPPASDAGRGAAGLRGFHRSFAPTHVLVPSLVRDPVDGSVRPDAGRAAAVAGSVPPGGVLVSGERHPGLRKVLRTEAARAGAHFVDAAPRDAQRLPGLEVATVCDRLVAIAAGAGLSAGERVRHMASLQRRMGWRPSACPGLTWFDAARHGRPELLRSALDHLAARDPSRAHAVLHVGGRRSASWAWVVPVLAQALEDGVLAHATLTGEGAGMLMPALRQLPCSLRPHASPGEALVEVRRQGRGSVVLLGDASDPWRHALAEQLRHPGVGAREWPLGAVLAEAHWGEAGWDQAGDAGDAGPHVPAVPVLAAPSLGQRPRVHILGDPDPRSPAGLRRPWPRPHPPRSVPPAAHQAQPVMA